MTKTLSAGKARCLQACATERGIFTILAIDHRDTLRALMDPDAHDSAALTEVKLAIVRHLAPSTSAVLLDPIYSAAQAIAGGVLSGDVALLTGLEDEHYLGDAFNRINRLLSGWTVEKAKRLGASGVKLLLWYHPDAGEVTEKQEQFVREVVADCRRYDIPLFLEPLSYSLDPDVPKTSAEFARERPRIVVESARRLAALGADVLKVEFPVDVRRESDPAAWHKACAGLNHAAAVPWALLSADEPYDTFRQMVQIACEEGCSGFLAGRTVWRGAASLTGTARDDFLANTALRRLTELVEIAQEFGSPWQSHYAMPQIDEEWYMEY